MQDDVEPYPSIAQLAERETVEAKQLSLGHWFESGWTETFFEVETLSSPINALNPSSQEMYTINLNTLASPIVRRFGIFI